MNAHTQSCRHIYDSAEVVCKTLRNQEMHRHSYLDAVLSVLCSLISNNLSQIQGSQPCKYHSCFTVLGIVFHQEHKVI